MQKSVIAAAVATALAAPAVALAQARIQIYGTLSLSLEGAQAKGADTNGAPLPATSGSSIRGSSVGGGYVASPATANVSEPARAHSIRRNLASATAPLRAFSGCYACHRRRDGAT